MNNLPLSFQNLSKDDALYHGREIAIFLRDATETMATHGAADKINSTGLFLCFNLLVDFLDIAAGEYNSLLENSNKDGGE